MSKLCVAVCCVAMWWLARAAAAPTHGAHLQVALADVLDSAVCPLRVHIDEVEGRVPRRIKMLKCAATPNPVCHAQGMTHACCRSKHHTFHTTCMEVTDTVLVRYKGSDDLVKYPVSIGCTCVIRPESPARQDR